MVVKVFKNSVYDIFLQVSCAGIKFTSFLVPNMLIPSFLIDLPPLTPVGRPFQNFTFAPISSLVTGIPNLFRLLIILCLFPLTLTFFIMSMYFVDSSFIFGIPCNKHPNTILLLASLYFGVIQNEPMSPKQVSFL